MNRSNNGVRRSLVTLSMLLVPVAALVGCMPRAGEVPSHLLAPQMIERKPAPSGIALVAVRWPLAVTPEAANLIAQVYGEKLLNGPSPYPPQPEAYKRIPEASTYYALELHAYLKSHLGNDAVLLEPYVVHTDASGDALQFKPVFDNLVPVAFALDVVEPPDRFFNGHSNLLETNIRLSVAPSASKPTCGLIAGSDFVGTFYVRYRVMVMSGGDCDARSLRSARVQTFMDYFSINPPAFSSDFQRSPGPKLELGSVLVFPDQAFVLPEDYVQRSARTAFELNSVKPDNALFDNLARLVANAASTMDLSALTRGAWHDYARRYDASLASVGDGDGTDGQKAQAIRALADVERKWAARQDSTIAEALLNGTFGKSFRQRRVADLAVLKRARANSIAEATQLLNAGLSSGLFGPPGSLNSLTLAQGMLEVRDTSVALSAALLEQVRVELGPDALARNRSLEVEIAGISRQIVAESRANLRDQLRQLYSERFRRR